MVLSIELVQVPGWGLVVNRYLDVDWQGGIFLRFWPQNASSIPAGCFFPAGSGFWALTVNKRLFDGYARQRTKCPTIAYGGPMVFHCFFRENLFNMLPNLKSFEK